ncbi:MAG: SCO family protein [Gemmatimonadales bacterium]
MKRWAFAGVIAGAVACGGSVNSSLSPHGFAGTELATALRKPDYQFRDSHGRPFRLDSATAGKVTLLMFGYTNCPDVCPVHLANLAAVLDKMPDEVQRNVVVVFVSIDPARDSLPVLNAWVKGFDPNFVGLTGPDSAVAAVQRELRLPPSLRERRAGSGYTVGHSSEVIAFTRDGWGRVAYPFGTRQREWAHDLPLLVAYGQGTASTTD